MAKTTKTEKTPAPKAKPAAKSAKAPAKTAAKAPKAAKAPQAETKPRHPAGRVKAAHGTKESLVKKLVEPLAAEDQDTDALSERLLKVSNQQLLRLERVVDAVKSKYGSRAKLIETLSKALNKAKDKDYLAKLGSFPLPRLLDMVRSAEKRARA
jgi:hypothetical protein